MSPLLLSQPSISPRLPHARHSISTLPDPDWHPKACTIPDRHRSRPTPCCVNAKPNHPSRLDKPASGGCHFRVRSCINACIQRTRCKVYWIDNLGQLTKHSTGSQSSCMSSCSEMQRSAATCPFCPQSDGGSLSGSGSSHCNQCQSTIHACRLQTCNHC